MRKFRNSKVNGSSSGRNSFGCQTASKCFPSLEYVNNATINNTQTRSLGQRGHTALEMLNNDKALHCINHDVLLPRSPYNADEIQDVGVNVGCVNDNIISSINCQKLNPNVENDRTLNRKKSIQESETSNKLIVDRTNSYRQLNNIPVKYAAIKKLKRKSDPFFTDFVKKQCHNNTNVVILDMDDGVEYQQPLKINISKENNINQANIGKDNDHCYVAESPYDEDQFSKSDTELDADYDKFPGQDVSLSQLIESSQVIRQIDLAVSECSKAYSFNGSNQPVRDMEISQNTDLMPPIDKHTNLSCNIAMKPSEDKMNNNTLNILDTFGQSPYQFNDSNESAVVRILDSSQIDRELAHLDKHQPFVNQTEHRNISISPSKVYNLSKERKSSQTDNPNDYLNKSVPSRTNIQKIISNDIKSHTYINNVAANTNQNIAYIEDKLKSAPINNRLNVSDRHSGCKLSHLVMSQNKKADTADTTLQNSMTYSQTTGLSQLFEQSRLQGVIARVKSSVSSDSGIEKEPSVDGNNKIRENTVRRRNFDAASKFNLTNGNVLDLQRTLYEQNEENVSLNEAICEENEDRLSQIYKSSQYRKEINAIFNNCEMSICQNDYNNVDLGSSFGNTQTTKCFNETIGLAAVKTIDWSNDTLITRVVDMKNYNNTNSRSESKVGDVIKQRLLNNAQKDIVPINIIQPKTEVCIKKPAPFFELGPFYGLPLKCKQLIHEYKKIDKLYDWQDQCLNMPAVHERKNLIYALPTSGGKTLVAEILILREVLCRKKNVIFILPFVSIVQEKIWALSPFAVALDFLVEEYTGGKGSCPPRKRRNKRSVYIATIEKSLMLVNSLAELRRLNEVGLIVVDELHLLGEIGRGATLETVLTKAIYTAEDVQIVGMSATIGNLGEIAKFLNAEVFTREFRPVELKEYVKSGNDIYAIDSKQSADQAFEYFRSCNYNYTSIQKQMDPDHLGGLVMEVVPQSSCLIFCPSKKNCENVALLLCRIFPPVLKEHRLDLRSGLARALKENCGALCPILAQTLQYGVAYHHSGLTSDERKYLEDAFRTGVICVICCTSTLAAGVNLPARRVILRSPYVARDFITQSRYKQMVGRAGRAGFGEIGESILLFEPKDIDKVKSLICSPMDEVLSNLHMHNGSGLQNLVLSAIGLNLATTRDKLRELIKKTLMAVQAERLAIDYRKITDMEIAKLFRMNALCTKDSIKNSATTAETSIVMPTTQLSNMEAADDSQTLAAPKKFVLVVHSNEPLAISKLGRAAIKGSINLKRAHMLYQDLKQAQASLVLLDCLHLLYLVTPYDVVNQVEPDMSAYYSIFIKLSLQELQTANILGINDLCAMRMLSGKPIKNVPERVLKRFFITLMLYDLWNQSPVHDVAVKFRVSRGIVQTLMASAASFASSVLRFCEELDEFWAFTDLLVTFTKRLAYCCTAELLPLMELPSVKQVRAKQLYKAGYKNLQLIARAHPDSLVQDIEHMSRRVANQLIAAAKLLLLQKVDNLREEAEEVLEDLGAK